jgi:hypothetical protein
MSVGKCPSCKSVVSKVQTEYVDIGVAPSKTWKGISYLCPSCKAILSVAIDPVCLADETADDVVNRLSKD